MKKLQFIILLNSLIFLFVGSLNGQSQNLYISVIENNAEKKVDILFNNQLFTSYNYPDTIEKPFLYPVYSSKGTVVTRGFPMKPLVGERVDHPHHFGIWFNFGDVNGLDFWNNSYVIPLERKSKYGIIQHQDIIKVKSGKKKGLLVVNANWVNNNHTILLNEETTFEFSGDSKTRRIDRITKLTALTDKVVFSDDKEGLLGFRVARAFEDSMQKPEILIGMDGKPGKIPVIDNIYVNGIYRNSNGQERDEAWGKRARWVKLQANKDNELITIAMFDYPSNFGYPAMWHARSYGLFSVNNFGGNAFDKKEPVMSYTLNPGNTIIFRHRIVITSGRVLSDKDMEKECTAFTECYK